MGKKNYGSSFGEPYQEFSKFILKYIENYYKERPTILIPNALDGLHVLTSVRKGFTVECYETVQEYINGGTIGNFNITGLKNKLNYFNMNDKVILHEKNFFETKVEREYKLVFCYKSLHLNENKHISKDKKMRKLLSSIKENGFIYLFYHIAENEKDYINYPKEQYFRRDEMIKYFDASWEIISIRENYKTSHDNGHPNNEINHQHLVGHIFAKKKYKKRKYNYHYKIKTKLSKQNAQ